MADYKCCDMTVDNINDVVQIENLSFKTPWSAEAFFMELTRNKCSKYRVIINNERVVAYGGMWIMLDEGHVTNIAVHPEYRGIGLGNKIVEDLLKCAKENDIKAVTLEVREGNTAAINLYKRWGFEEAGVRRGYYQDTNENAIIMWKYNI